MNRLEQFDAERVEQIFQEALEHPASGRDSFLNDACGDDRDLHDAVLELLQAAERVAHKPGWNSPAIHNAAAATAARGLSAPEGYELLERLGAGGMGVVYKAVRKDDGFSKLVALKMVLDAHPSLLTRFRQERQILAGLEHPNIVRLLDVGTTGEGTPYLGMEFIDGAPIDAYVTRNHLARRQLLMLFRKICDAVSFAHRNLVVHRDLKPANILVTPEGEPKLLDFGIAKLLDTDVNLTRTQAASMTLRYASPEQVRGGPITTASDIYSLGVLLYELLTGSHPCRETSSPIEMVQAITDEAPRPMTGIPADLANIVQMALRKEPERRYSSVEQFSDDLRRFLDGYPVAARPDTWRYRMTRFLGRNRIAMGISAVAVVLLISLATGMFMQWREARRRYADVREISNHLIFDVYDSVVNVPGTIAARKQLAGLARDYLNRLANEGVPDNSLRIELATAYRKLGDIQGEPYVASLGDSAGALESYQKGRALLESKDAGDGSELATIYQRIGRVLVRQGKPDEAREWQQKSHSFFERQHRLKPSDKDTTYALASALLYRGQSEFILGNQNSDLRSIQAGLDFYLQANDLMQSLVQANPEDRTMLARSTTYSTYPAFALWKLGELVGDPSYYRQSCKFTEAAVEAAEKLMRLGDKGAITRGALAIAYSNQGVALQKSGRESEGLAYTRRSLEMTRVMHEEAPDNREVRLNYASTLADLSRGLERQHPVQALAQYRLALAQHIELMRGDPKDMEAVRNVVETRNAMAAVYLTLGNRTAASDAYRQNLELLKQARYPGDLEKKVAELLGKVAL